MEIEAPGTLDGGDICEADNHFFLGLSHRTNEEGARQLAAHLAGEGYTSCVIDVRGMNSILHLKSGISYIGNNTLVVMEEMAGHGLFAGYDLIRVASEESYAANCVRVNERVLVAAGYPLLTAELKARGFHPLELEMSEFQKMDGGLSCLSFGSEDRRVAVTLRSARNSSGLREHVRVRWNCRPRNSLPGTGTGGMTKCHLEGGRAGAEGERSRAPSVRHSTT